MPKSEIKARIGLDNTRFVGGIKKSENEVSKVAGKLKAAGGAIAAGLAIDVLSSQLNKIVDRTTQIRDNAQEIGVDVESFQKLEFFLEQSSGNAEDLRRSFRNLARNRELALDGDNLRLEAFDRLGISVERLRNARLPDLFVDISKAVQSSDTESIIRPLTDLLGSRTTSIIPALKTDLEELFQVAEDRGIIITDEEIKKVSDLGDQLLTLKRQLESLAVTVGTPIIEGLTDFVKGFQDITASIKSLFSEIETPSLDEISNQVSGDKKSESESEEELAGTPRVVRILENLLRSEFGSDDPAQISKEVEVLRRALGDQLLNVELDDQGLVRNTKSLTTQIRDLISSLSSEQIRDAELQSVDPNQTLAQSADVRPEIEKLASNFLKKTVDPEKLPEFDTAISKGQTSAFNSTINILESKAESFEKKLQEAQRIVESEENLFGRFGQRRVIAEDPKQVVDAGFELVKQIGSEVSILQKQIEIDSSRETVLKPAIEELTNKQVQILNQLSTITESSQSVDRLFESEIRRQVEDPAQAFKSNILTLLAGGTTGVIDEVGSVGKESGTGFNDTAEGREQRVVSRQAIEAIFKGILSGGGAVEGGTTPSEVFAQLQLERVLESFKTSEERRVAIEQLLSVVNSRREQSNLSQAELSRTTESRTDSQTEETQTFSRDDQSTTTGETIQSKRESKSSQTTSEKSEVSRDSEKSVDEQSSESNKFNRTTDQSSSSSQSEKESQESVSSESRRESNKTDEQTIRKEAEKRTESSSINLETQKDSSKSAISNESNQSTTADESSISRQDQVTKNDERSIDRQIDKSSTSKSSQKSSSVDQLNISSEKTDIQSEKTESSSETKAQSTSTEFKSESTKDSQSEKRSEAQTQTNSRLQSFVESTKRDLEKESKSTTNETNKFDFERDSRLFTDLQKLGLQSAGFVDNAPARQTQDAQERQNDLIRTSNERLQKIIVLNTRQAALIEKLTNNPFHLFT